MRGRHSKEFIVFILKAAVTWLLNKLIIVSFISLWSFLLLIGLLLKFSKASTKLLIYFIIVFIIVPSKVRIVIERAAKYEAILTIFHSLVFKLVVSVLFSWLPSLIKLTKQVIIISSVLLLQAAEVKRTCVTHFSC